jgi:voltage-gated potassium channel
MQSDMPGEKATEIPVPALVERANITYELFIGVLAVFSLFVMAEAILLPGDAPSRPIWRSLDTMLCLIFMFDFFRSLVRAPSKKAYLKWGWLDFLGSIPGLPILRLARVPRIIRAARALRATGGREMRRQFLRRPAESTFALSILVAILVITLTSLVVLQFEREAPNANLLNATDAFWWSFVTVTTVGYGDRFPVTNSGRIMAALLMTVGVVLFGVLTSYLSTSFLSRGEKQGADDLAEIKADIAAMREELAALKDMLWERD